MIAELIIAFGNPGRDEPAPREAHPAPFAPTSLIHLQIDIKAA